MKNKGLKQLKFIFSVIFLSYSLMLCTSCNPPTFIEEGSSEGEINMGTNLALTAITGYTYSGAVPNQGALAYINDNNINTHHGYDAYNGGGVTPTVSITWTLTLPIPGYISSIVSDNYITAGNVTTKYKDLEEVWHTISTETAPTTVNQHWNITIPVNDNMIAVQIIYYIQPRPLGGGAYETSGWLNEISIYGDVSPDSRVHFSDSTHTYAIYENLDITPKAKLRVNDAYIMYGSLNSSFALPLRIYDGSIIKAFLGKII